MSYFPSNTCSRVLWLSSLFIGALLLVPADCTEENSPEGLAPHVFISVLVTNSMHLMRNFFGYLEGLDYPKDRISVWIRTDHNVDGTATFMNQWCFKAQRYYKSVDCHVAYKWVYPTLNPYSKSVQRYKNVARLRQQALEAAREAGADYLLTVDVDCFLVNSRTLQLLMEQNKTIVAPMLDAAKNSAYSNFWMAQDDFGYYERDEIYMPIVQRDRTGCFSAPVVFGTVLIHVSSPYSENLVYHPPHPKFLGPVNDVQQFAFSAQSEGVGMYILNTEFFGYIMQDEKYTDTNDAARKFFQYKLETLVNHPPVLYSSYLRRQKATIKNSALGRKATIKNSALGIDAVYVINLARRPERRGRMSAILDELGYNYTVFDAVDGRDLNDSYVEDELGIRYMATTLDPFDNRTMFKGEVGCFLSHHAIWKKMLTEKQKTILVMEDDVKFKPFFNRGLYSVLREAKQFASNWDYIYLGRNRVDHSGTERRVGGAKWLVHPAYSHSTLGYLLSSRGAKKLLAADPFHSLLPIDEFIAIMYGANPRKDWSENFPIRNLEVYSAQPTLIKPTHFDGQDGWFSDTSPRDETDGFRGKRKKEGMSKEDDSHREEVKKKAVQRQIEAVKMKMKAKDEL